MLALALCSLALAGCADDAPPDGADGRATTSGAAATPTQGTDADDDATASTEAPAPSLQETPVRIEGSTAAGACASVCHYEMTDTAFNVLEPDGGVRLAGTLTWDAVSPTSEQLTLYVPTYIGGEYHWEPGYPSASGASPLVFDLDLTGLGGVPLGLIFGNGVAAGTPAGVAAVQTPQGFVLDAVYTTSGASVP